MLYCNCLTVSHTHGMAVWDYTASRCVSFVSFPCWGVGGRGHSLKVLVVGRRGGRTVESLLKSIIRRHYWYMTSAPSLVQPLYPPTSTPPHSSKTPPHPVSCENLPCWNTLMHFNQRLHYLHYSTVFEHLFRRWGGPRRGSDLHYFFFKNLQRGTMITTLSNPATNTRLP